MVNDKTIDDKVGPDSCGGDCAGCGGACSGDPKDMMSYEDMLKQPRYPDQPDGPTMGEYLEKKGAMPKKGEVTEIDEVQFVEVIMDNMKRFAQQYNQMGEYLRDVEMSKSHYNIKFLMKDGSVSYKKTRKSKVGFQY